MGEKLVFLREGAAFGIVQHLRIQLIRSASVPGHAEVWGLEQGCQP